jgi:hypothetical protein
VRQESIEKRSSDDLSGVPQRSVLGPFLYLVYTSDLPRTATLTLAQFGDDLTISSRGRDTQTAAANLQHCTTLIENWNNQRWWKKMMT